MTTTIIRSTSWHVETCHLIHHPEMFVNVESMAELRSHVQRLADDRSTPERPFGEIFFRYELDGPRDEAVVTHCYFDNRHGKRQRFMRLRRES